MPVIFVVAVYNGKYLLIDILFDVLQPFYTMVEFN